MGRVWRDGQTKNVFIYRFIAGDTIEETIIERQSEKNELHSVIKDTPDDKSDTVVRARAIDEAAQEGVPVSNLQRMILPRGFLEDFPSSSSGYDEQSFESKGSHQDDVFHALTAPVSAICRDLCFLKDMS